jgi:hypothetical protein
MSKIPTTKELANPAVDPRVGDNAAKMYEVYVHFNVCLHEYDSPVNL